MADQNLIQSVNPATEQVIATFEPMSPKAIDQALDKARNGFTVWRNLGFSERARVFRQVALYLREHKSRLAGLVTAEMGKPILQAEAEVEKCAWNCEFYADQAEGFLSKEPHPSDGESYVDFIPLGAVLAIMPWNYPLWQVFRFAAPALMAGNAAILKHASNVPQCALAIEELFRASGLQDGVFQSFLISGSAVNRIIEDPRIAAVTLTGSDETGSKVAQAAGRAVKKMVLELGGSDPFIVLDDADIGAAVETGVRARYQNTGQSCIAAKRFVIVESVFDDFQQRFVEAVQRLRVGDPTDRTIQIGPLARSDLRETVELQVQRSASQGAKLITGGKRLDGQGYFLQPTVLANVRSPMPAYCEEVFGPVASLIKVRNTEEAIQVANDSPYGLGSNLWTRDLDRARAIARKIESGQVFINGMVASDPRLPFGGIKRSGYGRELSAYGIKEFVNIQTVWIEPART
ncbi:MAG: NAD-dependent succinate-semialdehyde dehydrogenase [Candidatus Binatia bacterium]